jgi:hypothetical protein
MTWEIADGIDCMSERDLQRIEVLLKVIDGRMSLVSAAHVLAHAPGASVAGPDPD